MNRKCKIEVVGLSLAFLGALSIAAPARAEEAQAQTVSAALGGSADSDFVAKNFSLVFGGIVLNQFQTEPDPTDSTKVLLKNGSTDAKAFIEGGYRRRWAWLDRDSMMVTAMKLTDAAKEREAVAKAAVAAKAAEAAYKAAEAGGVESEMKAAAQKVAETKADELRARDHLIKKARDLIKENKWDEFQSGDHYYSLASRFDRYGAFALIPDDWVVRMGFVFDGSTNSKDVVATVGASDLYGEFGCGWNLVQWANDTRSAMQAPIRGSLNLDVDMMMYTDDAINDIHGRGLAGLSVAFGVPMQSLTGASVLPGVDVIREQQVIELMARVGFAKAEVPAFADDNSRRLKLEHGTVDYRGDQGLGFDLELNVPITEKLGYLVARGQMNAYFDPNPWFIQLGYTIPLSTLVGGIVSGG